ncbi:ubiquitin carboxyl-terminal hydrolase 12-like isoform X1 [Papaver somniferum]|uniref:ubiquitin carboxyl-terminal hydrolase 12-like isoform X1 n=1 Tax=Papaver somniferum TaxID=3469 RepID=UPI000E6FAA25|nr:ubiquitin carboxyl-terminal hydrolase 12-like isoform X1 [Papaver somniferum]
MGTQILELPSTMNFIWKIRNFSKLNHKVSHYSDVFSAGGAKWKARIYPKGCGEVFDHLSIYLYRVDSSSFPVNVAYTFAITDQTNPANTKTVAGEKQFVSGTREGAWGYPKFFPLSKLHDSKKGYLVNDICEIKIEITRKIPANAKKPVNVKGKGKHLPQAKSVVKSNSGYSITWFGVRIQKD